MLAAARRAIGFADESISQWKQGNERVPAVVEKGHVKLGANAAAVAALARMAEVAGETKLVDRALKFAQAVRKAQTEDGAFIHVQRFPTGEVLEIDHPSYPGEAIVGLAAAARIDPEPHWADAVDRAARQLIRVRDKDVPVAKLTQDSGLLIGLEAVYRHKTSIEWISHTAKVSQAMALTQHRAPPFQDWLGGYFAPPGSTPAAVRTEALIAAYRLLRDHGPEAYRPDAVAALEAAILGAAFQLQNQFRPESAMYYPDPQRILGAFRESVTSPDIRIDFVQHNTMSLLALWRLMEAEKVASYAVPKARRPVDVAPDKK
jgi:hypothetical protein